MGEQYKFSSERLAQHALTEAGFCLGQMARDEPRGLMHKYDYIAKWRNLTKKEKRELHGAYQRHGRDGPVTITLQDTCPEAARAALRRSLPPPTERE